MQQKIINGKILSPDPLPEHYGILIDGDLILEVGDHAAFPQDIPAIDAAGRWVIPGLIDIHVHGGEGYDTMDAENEALAGMARYFLSTGVTSFLPTTTAASQQDVIEAVSRIRAFSQPDDGARVLGIHLEGPYLGHKHKGAQPEQHLRAAEPGEYMPWLESGVVKLFTVAPEVEGVMDLITTGTEKGVRFAVGHSSASYDTMIEAIERGLSQATHTFNGMPQLHHREPGVVGAVLTDPRVYAQIITDGIHLHPAVVDLVFKTKGADRTVLITDAIRAAGANDGVHRLGDQVVTVTDGIARISTGSLAGSTLAMDQALRNTLRFTGRTLEAVLPSATRVAAESIGMQDQIGALKPGLKADIVLLDENLAPRLCLLAGKIVYQNA